ncbi:hypothetical protein [Pseudanabaena sp. PCC 6802]|uniref:hypothetical protein n=1 Tax=Pseudanabaena sp. PCC 6802 TaxID=118173 RepID=UPI000372092A|nr:hypothetical protein [Pseudanabaena sp. PCC 6802]
MGSNSELGGFKYQWQHLRIRAEASGVALNARSSGSSDIDVRGLQALSKQLAKSAIESLKLEGSEDSERFSDVESAILRTLIQEWGTKSYEFRLDRLDLSSEDELSSKEHVFKAHCYFGAKPSSKTPDIFIHLNCYLEYGGSHAALEFLINELGIGVKK